MKLLEGLQGAVLGVVQGITGALGKKWEGKKWPTNLQFRMKQMTLRNFESFLRQDQFESC